jgi:uncharacterized protein
MKLLLLMVILMGHLVTGFPAVSAAPSIPPVPKTSIYCQDQAGVLKESTTEYINAYSKAIQKKTRAQIVVRTVNSLGGSPVEEDALVVLRGWGIGDKQKK